MKLLIADDEKLTREGIRNLLDLKKLGITEVFLADDGIHGLEAARSHRPDIILTDVRMPRMTGVEMASRYLEEAPDTAVLFMSAYSDREYLKAAIKLKAVNYIDKPLDKKELENALAEAADRCRSLGAAKSGAMLKEQDLKGHLVLFLTDGAKAAAAAALGACLSPAIEPDFWFSAVVTSCLTPLSELPSEELMKESQLFSGYLKEHGITRLIMPKADRYIISFLCSPSRPETKVLEDFTRLVQSRMKTYCRFFIAAGPILQGMAQASVSYHSAMNLLDESFYHDYNSVLTPQPAAGSYQPAADPFTDCGASVTAHKKEDALKAAEAFYRGLKDGPPLPAAQAKSRYFRYLNKLDEISLANHISLWKREGLESESIWEDVMNRATLRELHEFLCERIQLYFQHLIFNQTEHPVVFQIKEYIRLNYAVPTLSVPEISEYVNRSSSYVCTLFKNETGQTVNQYLTDYRIKMSKQFLNDPRYRIADISAKAGYSDGNYYSKAFRKIVGLSPSEYREKML